MCLTRGQLSRGSRSILPNGRRHVRAGAVAGTLEPETGQRGPSKRSVCSTCRHAVMFIFPVYAQQLEGIYRQGFGESLDLLLYRRKPADPVELMDRLLVEQKPILEAQAVIDVLGGQELIRGALEVALATYGVLDGLVKAKAALDREASKASTAQRVATFFSSAQTKLPVQMETALQEGTRRLDEQSVSLLVSRGNT
jgi:hypothetical protein